MTNVRQAVGNAIRKNEVIAGPWRRFRRKSALPKQSFRIGLERPSSRENVAERVTLQGWAVSLVDEPVTARILVNNTEVAKLDINKNREDVAAIFDLGPSESNVGFEAKIPWEKLFGNEKQGQICIEFTHQSEVVVLGPITLSKTDSPLLLHERGSYKQVWNDAASDHNYAMQSVSGNKNYSEFMESGVDSAKTMTEMLNITPDDVVLEIGCGTARIGATLAKHCKQWIGTDISANMLKYAAENTKHLDNVELIELSSCSLREFGNELLDKIYCTTVFMHLDEWERFNYVQEAFRALRPGGKFYVDNLNLAGDIGWNEFFNAAQMDPAARPANISKTSTAEELVVYLQRAGFVDIETFPGAHMVAATGVKPKD